MAAEDQVNFRLGELVKRVDRYAERMKETTHIDISRADAVRSLLAIALDLVENKSGKKGAA